MEGSIQREVCSSHVLSFLLTTLLCILIYTQPISAAKVPKAYKTFIITSCSRTTYPKLCTKTLMPYALSIKTNQLELSNRALIIAIKATHNASSLVSTTSKLGGLTRIESAALMDCKDNILTCMDELNQTLSTMSSIEEASDKQFQWSNAKTWASAAITNTVSCSDGFTGLKVSPKVRTPIHESMSGLGKRISIALALINNLVV